MRERYRSGLSDAGAGTRHRRDFFLCLHFHALVFSPLNMQKALRGDDFAAILILSININRPSRQAGVRVFLSSRLRCSRAGTASRMAEDMIGIGRSSGRSMPRGHVDRTNQY
ncbi:hypothetical protein [Burkholderia cenocepacia]|uniref:hypothetical protein n=1 Tax=Burkholderia cenocepacia TaxID=95486 RepID=UPI000A88E95C|nr:hypothetical protein [Burkholderia cenocepacia]